MNDFQKIFNRFFSFRYLLLIILVICIFFLNDLFSLIYNKKEPIDNITYPPTNSVDNSHNTNQNKIDINNLNILVIADSHLNGKAFPEIKKIALKNNVKLIVHLGDHTNYGSKEELEVAFKLLKSLDLDFVALPGDRDLAAAGGDKIFYSIFKKVTTLSMDKVNLLFIDNSPNFTLLTNEYLNQVIKELPNSYLVFMLQPIYVNTGNIFENKYMGSLNAFNFSDKESLEKQKLYLNQRNKILNQLRIGGKKLVIAGDHHRSSKFNDPENKSITYLITGASSEYLNSNGITISQRNFQTERISIISVDKDLNYSIQEIELFEK